LKIKKTNIEISAANSITVFQKFNKSLPCKNRTKTIKNDNRSPSLKLLCTYLYMGVSFFEKILHIPNIISEKVPTSEKNKLT
jgi:hypothetical protein